MESANFIPLGSGPNTSRGGPLKSISDRPERPERKVGQTAAERKAIAREIRNAAKKAKKKAKSDAKKQRKLNAAEHRRMNRNNEKYDKNKDRNKQREIDLERSKLRAEAVRQAERLAAKYDLTGKTFNVGPVVVLEDGSVRSEEALRITAERKAEREAEKKAAEEAKRRAVETQKAIKEGKIPPTHNGIEGVNNDRKSLIEGLQQVAEPVNNPRISKKQQERQAKYAPRPVPPKPVLPEGISVPEGEENFLALWDITDDGILDRMAKVKQQKGQERKALRRKQKEEKRFNKAMKAKKKQAAAQGVMWDPEKAKKEILGEEEEAESSDSDSDTDSDSDSDSDSSDVSDGEEVEEPEQKKQKQIPIGFGKRGRLLHSDPNHRPDPEFYDKVIKKEKSRIRREQIKQLKAAEAETQPGKSKKKRKVKIIVEPLIRPAVSEAVEEEQPKKKRKHTHDEEVTEDTAEAEKPKKSKKSKQVEEEPAAEDVEKPKKSKKSKQVENEETTAEGEKPKKAKKSKHVEEAADETEKLKKRKRDREEVDSESKPEKSHKNKKSKGEEPATNGETNGAEQWNPDALTGDEARKAKFLRLLGAGKSSEPSKHKSSKKVKDIAQVENELEKQYEAGMKMKHDGGSKRRGLGA